MYLLDVEVGTGVDIDCIPSGISKKKKKLM